MDGAGLLRWVAVSVPTPSIDGDGIPTPTNRGPVLAEGRRAGSRRVLGMAGCTGAPDGISPDLRTHPRPWQGKRQPPDAPSGLRARPRGLCRGALRVSSLRQPAMRQPGASVPWVFRGELRGHASEGQGQGAYATPPGPSSRGVRAAAGMRVLQRGAHVRRVAREREANDRERLADQGTGCDRGERRRIGAGVRREPSDRLRFGQAPNLGAFVLARQHLARYWPGRVQVFLRARWFPRAWPQVPVLQARANVLVTAKMVRAGGWAPWSL